MDHGPWPDGNVTFEIDILTNDRLRVDRKLVPSSAMRVSRQVVACLASCNAFTYIGGILNKVQCIPNVLL